MKKTLLILGRFQPFHLGHLGIIQKYCKRGYFIKIAIGSSEQSNNINNPFSAKERKEMIILSLKKVNIKNYKIYYVPDIKKDGLYCSHVKKIVGKFDVIFTGNPWTKRVFLCTNKKDYEIHFFNEQTERIKKISATEIRKKWLIRPTKKGLPIPVYKYFKKINAQTRLKNIFKNARDNSHFHFIV